MFCTHKDELKLLKKTILKLIQAFLLLQKTPIIFISSNFVKDAFIALIYFQSHRNETNPF